VVRLPTTLQNITIDFHGEICLRERAWAGAKSTLTIEITKTVDEGTGI
jgi:hypothetical protein